MISDLANIEILYVSGGRCICDTQEAVGRTRVMPTVQDRCACEDICCMGAETEYMFCDIRYFCLDDDNIITFSIFPPSPLIDIDFGVLLQNFLVSKAS